MFIEDIKNDFYNILLGNRVLLLVHYDVDALCTCKILQDLFKCDNISYTLVPVGRISELKSAYEENNEEIKYVVLINCGGTIDLVDILQPEEDVVFFVLDSHKPTDICNVYSDGQVRLIYKDDEENIPNFDDIFRDDDEDEVENEHEVREGLEARVERRRERKAWEERRHTLMFNYMQFSYYGKPSACVALELAERASRCGWEAVWAGAVALAAQDALLLRRPARLLLDAEPLQRRAAAAGAGHVVVEKDVWLPLYRWWSLEDALTHSATVATKLRLHSRSGAARLRQLLADMGFPLQQARQAYRAMDVELRRALAGSLEAAAARVGLAPPTRLAFLLKRPHAPALPAHDLVYVVMALIEHESIPPSEGFQLALAALSGGGAGAAEAVRRGVRAAQAGLRAAAALAADAREAKALRLAGPFVYYIVNEGAGGWCGRGPLWLGELARWVSAGAGGRPVLAAAPDGTAPPDGTADAQSRTLLLGLPPKPEHEPRNLFGAAFEQAAAKSGVSVSLEYVDTSVITLPTSQRTQFLDALTALLA